MIHVELNQVHMQRLHCAVQAARSGARVEFRVNQGEPCTLVWVDRAAPRTQRVILNFYGRKDLWLAAVRAAFDAEMAGTPQ